MRHNSLHPTSNVLRNCLWITFVCFFHCVGNAKDYLGQANLAEVLPETTQLLFASLNAKSSHSALEQSDVCKQLGGPIWQSAIAKQKVAKVGSLLNPRPWLGLDWQDISSIDQMGAVTAFLDSNGETALAFLAKLGPNAEKHPFVQRWIANQGGMGQFQSLGSNETTKLYSLTVDPKNDLPVCIAIGSQWTCISSSTKAVQYWLGSTTVKSVQGSTSNQSLQPVLETSNWASGETRFWMSPWAILNSYAAKKDPKLFRSAKLFGLEGLGALSGAILPPSNAENSWRLNYSQQLATPTVKGLAILSFKTGPKVEPPKMLSTSMDQVSISYLDMKPWFQGVSHALDQIIDEETPGNFADLIDSILTDPEGPKIDVRKELIYPSGPLMFNFGLTRPDKKNAGKFQHDQVWACFLPDSKKALTTINKLFENDKDIKSEQIGAYQIWNTINDESLFVAVSKGESQAVTVAAIEGNFLYLSTDTTWFKELISAKAASPEVNRVQPALWNSYLQKIKSPLFSFQQGLFLGSWFERSWTRLPEPTQKEYSSIDLPSFCLTNVLVPGLAVADIPRWSQVQPAFGVLTHSATQNERGIEGQVWLYAE